jgi:hypothetical protein
MADYRLAIKTCKSKCDHRRLGAPTAAEGAILSQAAMVRLEVREGINPEK